jgi:hypothetical protein
MQSLKEREREGCCGGEGRDLIDGGPNFLVEL